MEVAIKTYFFVMSTIFLPVLIKEEKQKKPFTQLKCSITNTKYFFRQMVYHRSIFLRLFFLCCDAHKQHKAKFCSSLPSVI